MEGPVRHSVRSLSRSESLESSAPEDFLDPITMVLMEHPVTLPETGRTYELSSIQEWFERGNWTCPLTNIRLKELVAVSNPVLKDKIENWKRRSGPAGEPGRSDSLVNGCMLDPEGTTEVTHVYHFNGTIHTGVPTEAEMIRHRREVHVAAKQLKEMIGPRRVLTVLRMIWDPEQGWTSRQDGGADCYIAGPDVEFGNSGCTTLSMLLQPRPNPDGTLVFNEAISSLELLGLKIRLPGISALARALGAWLSRDGDSWVFNRSLTTLRLARNFMDDDGTKEIAGIFMPKQAEGGDWVYCTAIKHLDLAFNNIGDEGARALAEAVGPRQNADGAWVWSPLEKLNMYGNPRVGDHAIAAIVSALLSPKQHSDGSWAYNPHLKHLCIDGTSMGASTLEAVLEAFETKYDLEGRPEVNNSLALVDLTGSETESSLKQLMMSSLGKVLDKKSNWHTLQAARRQLQNQRFLTRKFQGTWISIKL